MMNELEVNVGYEKEQKVLWNTFKKSKTRRTLCFILCLNPLKFAPTENFKLSSDLRVILFTLQKEVDCQTFQGRR